MPAKDYDFDSDAHRAMWDALPRPIRNSVTLIAQGKIFGDEADDEGVLEDTIAEVIRASLRRGGHFAGLRDVTLKCWCEGMAQHIVDAEEDVRDEGVMSGVQPLRAEGECDCEGCHPEPKPEPEPDSKGADTVLKGVVGIVVLAVAVLMVVYGLPMLTALVGWLVGAAIGMLGNVVHAFILGVTAGIQHLYFLG